MTPAALQILSFLCAVVGLACFLGPTIRRLRGGAESAPASPVGMRSRLWWAGFLLTILALMLQRVAAGAAP